MRPFLNQYNRNTHEDRQGVRIFCDGGCRFGANCPHIYELPFNQVAHYRRHRDHNGDKGPTTSRMRRAGYVPGVKVYVDYEGAHLGKGVSPKKRREPFNRRYGKIENEDDGNGNVTILFFDTLETETFREGFTLTKVFGGDAVPPFKRPKRRNPPQRVSTAAGSRSTMFNRTGSTAGFNYGLN